MSKRSHSGPLKTVFLFILPLLVLQAGPVCAASQGAPDFGFEPGLPAASASARVALAQGRACLRRGDEPGAEARWKARLRHRDDDGLLDALGSLYFREQRLAKAEECYDRLTRRSPASALGWYRLGLVRAARGHYQRGSDAQRLAVGLAPTFGPAYCALALDLRESGQRSMSTWAVRRALSLMPDYAGAWNLLGALQQDAGRLDDAHRSFTKALQLEADYPGAWFNLAQLWELQGRRDMAVRCYGKAILAKPSFAEARLARAELSMDQGSLKSARKDFEACRKLEDWTPEGWWGLRRVDSAEGHKGAARQDLRRYYATMRQRDRTQARRAARGMEEASPYEPELPPPADAAGKPLETQP